MEYTELLESLLYFIEKNNLANAIVTSIQHEGIKELERVKLIFIPAACYAYVVGENTIRQAKESYGL